MGSIEIAEKIRTARKSHHMTQEELAKAVGVSRSAVAMWEIGSNEPNFDMISALADVFNVPRSWFVSADDATVIVTKEDRDRLEALHQNPRLGMLFDRTRNMSDKDIEMILSIANRIVKEDE